MEPFRFAVLNVAMNIKRAWKALHHLGSINGFIFVFIKSERTVVLCVVVLLLPEAAVVEIVVWGNHVQNMSGTIHPERKRKKNDDLLQ